MANVKVYTTTYCPHCVAAKSLLQAKGIEFEEIDLTEREDRHDFLMGIANGQKTVPQIFINDQHIGGNMELQGLNKEGKLDQLLAA